jgi:hypothetical protein
MTLNGSRSLKIKSSKLQSFEERMFPSVQKGHRRLAVFRLGVPCWFAPHTLVTVAKSDSLCQHLKYFFS